MNFLIKIYVGLQLVHLPGNRVSFWF